MKTSVTPTLFVGARLWEGAELCYNPERYASWHIKIGPTWEAIPGPSRPSVQMDLTRTRRDKIRQGRGLNMEQQFGESFGGFLHPAWNGGKAETFAFA